MLFYTRRWLTAGRDCAILVQLIVVIAPLIARLYEKQ